MALLICRCSAAHSMLNVHLYRNFRSSFLLDQTGKSFRPAPWVRFHIRLNWTRQRQAAWLFSIFTLGTEPCAMRLYFILTP